MSKVKDYIGASTAQPLELINHMLAAKYKLNERHIKMLEIYFSNGLNMTDAYIRGYGGNPDPARRLHEGVKANKVFKSKRIQNYLTESMSQANKKIGLISIDEVVSELVTILKKDDARDQDKIKSAELLLKHLNAFENHNKGKAPKQLVIQTVEKLSEQQIIEELKRLSSPIQVDTNFDDEQDDYDTEDGELEIVD